MTNLQPAMWLPEHNYTPGEDRSVIRTMRTCPGVQSFNDFTTTVSSPPDWNVTVGPGRAVIDGTISPWTAGSYVIYSPSPTTVPVQPSDPTRDRYDVVILHIYDAENSDESGFGWAVEVVQGTPGVATPPTLPPNCLTLQGIKIAAGDTAVTVNSLFGLNASGWQALDFRHPNTVPLLYMHDQRVAAMNAYRHINWFNLNVPAGWEQVALWPFDTVMRTTYYMHLWGMQGPATFWWISGKMFDPIDQSSVNNQVAGLNAGTWPNQGDLRQFTATTGDVYYAMTWLTPIPRGTPPIWDSYLLTNSAYRALAITEIYPRESTTIARFNGQDMWPAS